MTLPEMPAFADLTAPSLPLHVVPSDGLEAFLAIVPAAQAAWLRATGFEAGLGEVRLLPGTDGAVIGAVAGFGTASARRRQRFGLAKAVAGLPAGAWRIEGALSVAERFEAVLGWLLSLYSFTRYRPGKAAVARALPVCPDGVDAALVLAMARGEFLTRDLITTPAQDMGPDELEAAFAGLAARFGAAVTVVRG